jgi:hypothetical protein
VDPDSDTDPEHWRKVYIVLALNMVQGSTGSESGRYEYLKIRFREATIPGGRTSGRPLHQTSRAWQIRWIPLPISRLPSSSRAASAGSQGGIDASGRSKCSNLKKCRNIKKAFIPETDPSLCSFPEF